MLKLAVSLQINKNKITARYRCWNPCVRKTDGERDFQLKQNHKDITGVPDTYTPKHQGSLMASFEGALEWDRVNLSTLICTDVIYPNKLIQILILSDLAISLPGVCTSVLYIKGFWFAYSSHHLEIFISLMNIDVTFDYC